ncbi:hypothetical protein C8R46DRAFT_95448 [Mycena filopes]|nr:hypothetical protein C8R46DRAFT_95448 [Mycena filopes]
MEPEPEPAPVVRVQNLWFEDGGIVVKAQNSLFRVSRGILMLQSPIFADMFSIPQPADAEVIDGCPVAELPDAAEDVNVFLKTIFDSSFFEAYPAQTTHTIIAGVLRLSTKYEVEHLRRRALVHFSSMYPTTLAGWDLIRSDTSSAWQKPSWSRPDSAADNIALITLARQVGALWILPAALYDLTAAADTRPGPTIFGMGEGVSPGFLNGYLLQRDNSWIGPQFLSDPVSMASCDTPLECSRLRLAALRSTAGDCIMTPGIPLSIWGEDQWTLLTDMCPDCVARLRELHSSWRQKFWASLPTFYSLGMWQLLEADKSRAMGQ